LLSAVCSAQSGLTGMLAAVAPYNQTLCWQPSAEYSQA
jgi:hypothetical protein